MLKKSVSILALTAALGFAPVAYAQTQTDTTATPPAATAPSAQTESSTPSTDSSSTSTMGQTAPSGSSADTAAPTTPPSTADTTPPATTDTTTQAATTPDDEGQPVDGQITMQNEGTYLGTDLIGTTVYTAGDESIGDVNDVIITTDGRIDGVVVGVGGFLGIGEKNVALKLDTVQMVDQGDNTVKLTVSSTKEELEKAPSFKTVADAKRETDAATPASGAMTGAPATTTTSQ